MMQRVLVVCTVHQDTGRANATELQSFLERIRPEVIFLELPSVGFDGFVDGSPGILESIAASRYRATHPVALVPVDLPTPGADFRRATNHLLDRVEDASPEYCRLRYSHAQHVSAGGFAYLNSAESCALWSAIQLELRKTIEALGDHKLREIFTSWTHANELRETAMMKSIEDYAMQHPFGTGVFLVGLAHRQSIIDKSRLGFGDGAPAVRWIFEGYLGWSRELPS